MFKKNKWDIWYDAQPEHVKRWIDSYDNPLWSDRDLAKFAFIAFLFGLVIGLSF